MDTSQLMISNYVKVRNDAGFYRVWGLSAQRSAVQLFGGARDYEWHAEEKIKGIRLNDDILKRMGFIAKGNEYSYQDLSHKVLANQTTKDYLVAYTSARIKYVHELQNIYFILHQIELRLD